MKAANSLIKDRLTKTILIAQDVATYGAGYQTGNKPLDILIEDLRRSLVALKQIELNNKKRKSK